MAVTVRLRAGGQDGLGWSYSIPAAETLVRAHLWHAGAGAPSMHRAWARGDALAEQVRLWQSAGCRSMKIKIGQSCGAQEGRDLRRVARLRELTGPDVELMVDVGATPWTPRFE